VDGRTVRIGLRPGGARGTYLVSYRVTSADNHPVGGSFLYSVGAPSASGSGPGSGTSGSGGAVTVAFPVVRILGYISLALLVGAALVLSVLWPERLDRRGAVRLLWIGAIAVAVTGLLEVLLEIWYVSGPLDEVGWSQARTVMLSQFGAAHSVRIGVALAAPLLLSPLIYGAGRGTTRALAMMVGVLGLATWPASGHPAASPVPALSLVADLTHLAAMSVWLGGLAMLAVFLLPRAHPSELAGIVPIWSRWAQVAVSVLLATGVVQSVIEVGSVDGLFAAGYGWLVLAKAGLLAGVLGLAWQSRRLVPRVAAHAAGATARLRGLVLAEAAGIAVVLAVASVLVQTPPARSAEVAADSNEQTVLLSNSLYRLSVQIVPGTVGLNELNLYAYTPEGGRADVKEWMATAAPSKQNIEPVGIVFRRLPPDRAVGQVTIPSAGQWRFVFTLRTTEVDQASVTATFDIGTG
jgi:copper transport protein